MTPEHFLTGRTIGDTSDVPIVKRRSRGEGPRRRKPREMIRLSTLDPNAREKYKRLYNVVTLDYINQGPSYMIDADTRIQKRWKEVFDDGSVVPVEVINSVLYAFDNY
jgi:hypothetical protein